MSKISRTRTLVPVVAVALLTVTGIAATSSKPSCNVVGAWELAGITRDGKAVDFTPGRKLVTRKYFTWINQEPRRDTLPLRTPSDSMRVFRIYAGSGTYTLSGQNYTEHIDFFIQPSIIGSEFKATCRTTGSRWYHSYTIDGDSTSHTPSMNVVEEWRRVE